MLYVGKAVDLRRRVRSYFTGDERRKVSQLLREVAVIDHVETAGELEARLAPLGARLALEVIGQMEAGTVQGRKQDPVQVTRAPKLTKRVWARRKMARMDSRSSVANSIPNDLPNASGAPGG